MAKKEKPTIKVCKHCKTEIPYDAKVCPQCHKRVKGGKLKWIVIALIVIFVLAVATSNGGRDTNKAQKVGTVGDTTSQEPSSTTETEIDAETESEIPTEETVQTEYHVGDILQDGDMKIVYIASGDYVEENEYSQPDDGYKYIFLKFAFENTSKTSDDSISFYSFECYADGYSCKMYYGGDENLSATLSAGRMTTGCLYFIVPEDSEDIEVEYTTNVFTSDKISFVYDGEQDCGYVLEKNTEASADAFRVGDVVEAGNLTISYLSCGVYESDNQFIQPKEGYHFIYCEFEFENAADSNNDEYVSVYKFDCYADGVSCDACYYIDDALSATISAGHKAKGTVAFEVPEDAVTVEVEYLTNYWTSNRIVFTYTE